MRAFIIWGGSLLREMISLFSSLANSVISSPFMSRSFVGKAVVNSVKFSVFMVFLVTASAFPRPAPASTEAKRRSERRM